MPRKVSAILSIARRARKLGVLRVPEGAPTEPSYSAALRPHRASNPVVSKRHLRACECNRPDPRAEMAARDRKERREAVMNS